jgi:hypothetical protein
MHLDPPGERAAGHPTLKQDARILKGMLASSGRPIQHNAHGITIQAAPVRQMEVVVLHVGSAD